MADRGDYFVVCAEFVPGRGGVDEAEAIALASTRTAVDGKHRAVVRVCARINPSASPAPVVIRYDASGDILLERT
jgi:hypothetical protein